MLLEVLKPLVLIAVILSLLMVFHAAFLEQDATTLEHLEDCLAPTLLATVIALAGGLCFLPQREARARQTSLLRALLRTFPVQVLYSATAGMALMFVAAWYVETYLQPFRNLR